MEFVHPTATTRSPFSRERTEVTSATLTESGTWPMSTTTIPWPVVALVEPNMSTTFRQYRTSAKERDYTATTHPSQDSNQRALLNQSSTTFGWLKVASGSAADGGGDTPPRVCVCVACSDWLAAACIGIAAFARRFMAVVSASVFYLHLSGVLRAKSALESNGGSWISCV